MKNLTIILTILLMSFASVAFSQDKKELSKTQIKPALLVIDIQNVYLKMIPEKDKEIGLYYINALIELFRSQGYPIIRVYHYDKINGPQQDSEQFEFPNTVMIKSDDAKVIKTYPDGFNKTDLDKVLKEKGCNTLFLCGLSAVGCVLATWIGANNNDYEAFLIKDAIMSHNSAYTDNIEIMFDAVGYDVVKVILKGATK